MKRLGLAFAAAVAFVFAVFCDAWFFGGHWVTPLRPGEWVGRIAKESGVAGGAGTYQALFLAANVVVWTLAFFLLATLWRSLRRH